MPMVSPASSALKSPLRYDRRVKRGIRFPNDSINPQTADDIRKTAALPTSKTGLMIVELIHRWPLTCMTHVLDRLKIHWVEIPHTAITAARDTPKRSPAVYTLHDSHNKLVPPFIFHHHVYSSPHSSSRLDPPLQTSWDHTLVIQSLP